MKKKKKNKESHNHRARLLLRLPLFCILWFAWKVITLITQFSICELDPLHLLHSPINALSWLTNSNKSLLMLVCSKGRRTNISRNLINGNQTKTEVEIERISAEPNRSESNEWKRNWTGHKECGGCSFYLATIAHWIELDWFQRATQIDYLWMQTG